MVVNAGLGSPLVLLSCVVIPLLPCLLLLHQRGHLDSPDVKRRLAFLYCSYRSVPADPHLLGAVITMSFCVCACKELLSGQLLKVHAHCDQYLRMCAAAWLH
jgi:hypothetical protein